MRRKASTPRGVLFSEFSYQNEMRTFFSFKYNWYFFGIFGIFFWIFSIFRIFYVYVRFLGTYSHFSKNHPSEYFSEFWVVFRVLSVTGFLGYRFFPTMTVDNDKYFSNHHMAPLQGFTFNEEQTNKQTNKHASRDSIPSDHAGLNMLPALCMFGKKHAIRLNT